jgi:hypothetical protein
LIGRSMALVLAIFALALASASAQANTIVFSYTGVQGHFTVPAGVSSIHVVAIGAPGGNGDYAFGGGGAGGDGAQATADLAVTPGESLYVEVGGVGGSVTGFAGGAGGFNGGRAGGSGDNTGSGDFGGGGGGGASDVRTLPAVDGLSSLNSRVIVAGGGGGGGGSTGSGTTDGGAADKAGSPSSGCGGTTGIGCGGGAGTAPGGSGGAGYPTTDCTGGDNGALGVGAAGGGGTVCTGGGGGGGGLYGGGGGGSGDNDFGYGGGGGGGSSGFGTGTTHTSVGADTTGTPSITFTFTARQPDAQIKLASDTSYLGAGVFNLTGAGQTRTTTTAPGKRATFDLRFANAGSASDSIGVLGCTGSGAFKSQYFQGNTNVTSAVTAGSYNTGKLAVGAGQVLKLKIAVSSTATTGKVFTCAVLASSQAAPSHRDVVKAKIKVG